MSKVQHGYYYLGALRVFAAPLPAQTRIRLRKGVDSCQETVGSGADGDWIVIYPDGRYFVRPGHVFLKEAERARTDPAHTLDKLEAIRGLTKAIREVLDYNGDDPRDSLDDTR